MRWDELRTGFLTEPESRHTLEKMSPPQIYLDYDVDVAEVQDADCQISPQGIKMRIPWKFEFGAVLSVTVVEEGEASFRIEREAVVVESHPDGEDAWWTTVAFLEE